MPEQKVCKDSQDLRVSREILDSPALMELKVQREILVTEDLRDPVALRARRELKEQWDHQEVTGHWAGSVGKDIPGRLD